MVNLRSEASSAWGCCLVTGTGGLLKVDDDWTSQDFRSKIFRLTVWVGLIEKDLQKVGALRYRLLQAARAWKLVLPLAWRVHKFGVQFIVRIGVLKIVERGARVVHKLSLDSVNEGRETNEGG